MSGLVLLSLLFVSTGVTGFNLNVGVNSNSQSHWDITEKAILNVTAQACHGLAQAEHRDFTFPASLTAQSVIEACAAQSSAKDFAVNKFYIKGYNALVNIDYARFPSHHFDDESFNEGKKHITDGLYAVKASIKNKDFVAARRTVGEILHTLQDFYSHSNWVELGNDRPDTNLIKKDANITNIAAKSRVTCRNCTGNCTNNILDDILNEKLLTSGYFSLWPDNSKPTGKCSHGDILDNTRLTEATGGINKDSVSSSHGYLHSKAAEVAIAATYELLDDVRAAVGDKDFLGMMGVSPGKALCFVIDTTASMGYDIEAVQYVTSTIIKNLLGTINEPSVYILVPFNDPEFGPVVRTTDLTTFTNSINALTASGGGDEPEMSLSGLQLALTAASFGSVIYLFTDASAKDAQLKNTITALIERTHSVVNFVLSGSISTLQEQVYQDLAQASGGQVVKMTKDNVYPAIQVFLESPSSNLVTLLQAVRNPGKSENFLFTVDETVKNPTIYITGTGIGFTLIDPSGAVQETTTGSLTTSASTVGNLLALKLKTTVGQWEIKMKSTNPYTLNIMAQSPVDFIFSFMKPSQRSDGYAINSNRPTAGLNGTLLIILSESDTTTMTEVDLVYSSGAGQVKGNITSQNNKEYLVQFDNLPSEEFAVFVKLQNGSSLSKSTPVTLQRQSTTNIKVSLISVTANESVTIFEPGSTLNMSFMVSTKGVGGTFTIQATNNQGFSALYPSTLEVVSGSSAPATVQMTAPSNTKSGTEVTLTIVAEAPAGREMNYCVSTLTVLQKVTNKAIS